MSGGALLLRLWVGDRVVVERCQFRPGAWFRIKGLIGRRSLAEEEGILLRPCNSIHMFLMKFPIDAVFLNASDQVVFICHSIQPWRISPLIFSACSVVELKAGRCSRVGLQVGDQCRWEYVETNARIGFD